MLRRLFAAAALACLAACGDDRPSSPVAGYMDDPAAVTRGRQVFAGTCGAYCHKLNPGQGGIPYLFDCTWIHGGTDQEIFATISGGVPGTQMLGFGGALPGGDDDIWKIIAYIRTTAKCSD